MNDIDIIKKILNMKSIAVVGFSPNKKRPSHFVSIYLKSYGYNITPINPGYNEIAAMRCYPNLLSISADIEVVNIFRKSEFVPDIVSDAISIGAKAIWMQDGIKHDRSYKIAQDAGLEVIMDDCMLRQHQQLRD